MGVVNNGHEHFAGAMDAEGLLDQQAFGVMVAALELDLEGFTEDAQDVVIGVESAVDHRGDQALGVVVQEGVFENAFAGAGFAEAALLAWTLRMSKFSCWWARSVTASESNGLRCRPKCERILGLRT
jgi:hypothetical protein